MRTAAVAAILLLVTACTSSSGARPQPSHSQRPSRPGPSSSPSPTGTSSVADGKGAKIGVILVNINPAYRSHELRYVLTQSGVSLLFAAVEHKGSDYRAMVSEVAGDCPQLREAVYFGEPDWQRLLADGRLGVLDFGAVDRLPDGLPPFFGRLLRIMHDDNADVKAVERELREYGFLRPGIDVDLEALRTFLAPMAEPSKVDSFKFTREWLRGEAARVTDVSTSNITRKFNLPPSYVLIHRVSTAGIGVLCQLECEGEFRAEVLR